jgi:hypothetical protein
MKRIGHSTASFKARLDGMEPVDQNLTIEIRLDGIAKRPG